jgi:hypothetical protein
MYALSIGHSFVHSSAHRRQDSTVYLLYHNADRIPSDRLWYRCREEVLYIDRFFVICYFKERL